MYQEMLLGNNPYYVSCIHVSCRAHYHHEIELLYCVEGEADVISDGKEYHLVEGSILIINSLAMHQVTIEKEASILVLEFGALFLGREYNKYAAKVFSQCLVNPQEEFKYRPHFERALNRLYTEYTENKEGSLWAIKGFLYEIFSLIVRHVPKQQQNAQKQKRLDKYMKIQDAFNLVQNEYNKPITLKKVSAHVGYDPRAFCRLFKSITNMTFHDYLNFHRINISMRLLEHKAYSISEIGQMVGIPVAKTFSRLFRKYTGKSPSEYRSML